MLKHRIIPVLLTDGTGQCVKPVAFGRPYRKLGTMEQYINVIERRNVDELFIIDITATEQGREPDFKKLNKWCSNLFCPVTYGGGIKTLDHIQQALQNGADKVAIKTNISIIPQAAQKFGAQAIVGVLDCIYEYDIAELQEELYTELHIFEQLGVGEILITDTSVDGRMDGYNLDLIGNASDYLDIPVVALGGCGEPVHMLQALEAGASAVAAGSMFLYTDITPRMCAEQLSEWGCEVRCS